MPGVTLGEVLQRSATQLMGRYITASEAYKCLLPSTPHPNYLVPVRQSFDQWRQTASPRLTLHEQMIAWGSDLIPSSVWKDWTPTVSQGTANPIGITVDPLVTRTALVNPYLCSVAGKITFTAAGQASAIVVLKSLPVSPLIRDSVPTFGDALLTVAGGAVYRGFPLIQNDGTVVFSPANNTTNGAWGNSAFTAALAAGDVLQFQFDYAI